MADRWLCLIDGHQVGPVSLDRLKQLAQAGRLKGDDYIRPEVEPEWGLARDMAGLIPQTAVTIDRSERTPPVPAAKRRNSGPLPVAKPIEEFTTANAAPPPPRGVAVSAGAIPTGSIPTGTPVAPAGAPLPAPPRTPAAPISPVGPIVASDPHERLHAARPAKNQLLPLIVGGTVAVVALGMVLILVASGAFSSGEVEVADADDIEHVALNAAEEFDGEESNPEAEEPAAADAAKTTLVSATATKPSADKLLKSVRRWTNVSQMKFLKLGNTKLYVTGVWLATSEQGEPYVATAKGSESPKYLVLKVKIENSTGAAAIKYAGWDDEATLVDESSKAIRPLAPGDKKSGPQQIEAGQSHEDTLVFKLDNPNFEKLRLLLPHKTIGVKDSLCFGLEVPRQAIGRGLDIAAAKPDPSTTARLVSTEAAPAKIIDESPAPAEAAAKPAESSAEPAAPTEKMDKPAAAAAKKGDDDIDGFLEKLRAKQDEQDKMKK